ncbi:unnamed protein product (macronuclear) [Paramecium tetraurelia]|uniref:F-box domain-containing protein n=1 Tax=Paramecium tetraurelia TaxID=5888 RepID=A0BI50_PARTE|nr:uncharacterized protein GSPATT00029253001 [Paramecium tetraurelia]CAK58217.1 unnamed protein product [Paramecium tetraurelia]|eukprot:XP_001425615.1 hypothetical protein (macronuclear) [Paramecium tetraurelia strain d4-2]
MNQIETNNLTLNSECLQQVLSYIPINQRLKMRELNSFFDQAVCSTSFPLLMDLIQDENFKPKEVNNLLSKFVKPQQIIFPNLNARELQELVIPKDLSDLIKFDSYLITDVPLEYIEKVVSASPKLRSFGFKNRNTDDLSNVTKSLSKLSICELKVGEWNQQVKEIVIQQADHLKSITIEKGNNEVLRDLIALYNSMKHSSVSNKEEQLKSEQSEFSNKLNLQEIRFTQFESSSNQHESLEVFEELLNQYHLKSFHFGIIQGEYQEQCILLQENFFQHLKEIQELQFGFKDQSLLMKVKLKKIESLRLSGFKFVKENFQWLMKQAKLFNRIDLRECTFDFAFTDSIEKVEQHDTMVDVYVRKIIILQGQYENQ